MFDYMGCFAFTKVNAKILSFTGVNRIAKQIANMHCATFYVLCVYLGKSEMDGIYKCKQNKQTNIEIK